MNEHKKRKQKSTHNTKQHHTKASQITHPIMYFLHSSHNISHTHFSQKKALVCRQTAIIFAHLSACWSWIDNHRLEHLRCRNHRLAYMFRRKKTKKKETKEHDTRNVNIHPIMCL